MNNVLNLDTEPPSCNGMKAHVLIGKNSHGHWVVKDEKGLRGGIFVDRVQALKYAMHDLGQRIQAVIMVPGVLELDIGGTAPAMARIPDNPAVRRAA